MIKLTRSLSRRTVLRAVMLTSVGLTAPAVRTGQAQAAYASLTITSWGGV